MRSILIDVFNKKSQLIRFVISGTFVALVGLFTLFILVDLFNIWYLLSSVVAFMITIVVNFLLQKFWTFKNSESNTTKQFVLFCLSSLLYLVLNIVLMYGMVDIIGIHHLFSQGIVMVILACLNYTIYSLYIFRTPRRN